MAPAWKAAHAYCGEPLRHSQFSDAVGCGVRIIFNIDAYSVDRFAFLPDAQCSFDMVLRFHRCHATV